ncbi:hypothetical protein [Sphingomonas sp.]|uniref:hypothetical protein n=1 Tax=Sphingomonas sp. TaxID=28214 RepID=UPI00286EA8D1|nr:hypothetical protein [Sphingomonas sp.]
MKKIVSAIAGISLISAPAAAQVRPTDCVPVLPIMDDVAAVAPLDVVAESVVPAAARRSLFGLPLLLPLLAAGGVGALIGDDDDDDDDDDVVSPA